VEQYRRQQEEEQRKTDERFGQYLFHLKELDRLATQKQEYKPQRMEEDLHPLFVEALKNIPHIEHWLDSYDWRCEGE
jgi:hypothetical protein